MGSMFNPAQIVIDQYVERLRDNYTSIYGLLASMGFWNPSFPGSSASSAASRWRTSPTPTRHITTFTTPSWSPTSARRSFGGGTDASLTPYHVTRSKLFVEERFGKVPQISAQVIHANIEHTRFPVPADEDHADTAAYPGLLRAADLIGQMADVNYPRKISALFREFQETGTAQALGYETAADLMEAYPKFFWGVVSPLITEALFYLRKTQIGKMWVNSLYANVFAQEHRLDTYGPERNT